MVLRVEHAESFHILLLFCKADGLFSLTFIGKNCDLQKKCSLAEQQYILYNFFV